MNDQHGAVFLLRGTVGERPEGPDVGSLGLGKRRLTESAKCASDSNARGSVGRVLSTRSNGTTS